MSDIMVVVPFKDEPDLTCKIAEYLHIEAPKYVDLYDNGSSKETHDRVNDVAASCLAKLPAGTIISEIHWMPEAGIYQMWNNGLVLAAERSKATDSYIDLAVFNNDITLPPGALQVMSEMLRSSDDIGIVYANYDLSLETFVVPESYSLRDTRGTYKDGGMGGWCWMIKAELFRDGLIPLIDENLGWWFGDDFIEWKVREAGFRVCRIEELPVDHLNEATASNGENNWTHEQKAKDLAYWNATYR